MVAVLNPNTGENELPNFNKERNCHFGVLHGNTIPGLVEEIMENGENLSFKAAKKEIHLKVQAAVDRAFSERESDITCDLECELGDLFSDPNDAIAMCWDLSDLTDNLVQHALEELEIEEPSYRYDGIGWTLEMTYLGGAPLIYVVDSDFVTWAHRCSPCMPGAGDLDSPAEFDEEDGRPLTGHMSCLCLPPKVWEDYGMKCPYNVKAVDKEGHALGKWIKP